MEERSPIPQAQRRLMFQDRVKAKEHCYEQCARLSHIEKRTIANQSYDQTKTLRIIHSHSIVSKQVNVNEHGKYSNFPGCHRRSDKGGRLQDKAFNVDVLNLEHIDKWKHNQRDIVQTGRLYAPSTNSSSRSSLPSKPYCETYVSPSKQQSLLCSNHSITSSVGFAQGEPNRERIICLLSPPKPISNVLTKLPKTKIYSAINYSHLHPVIEGTKGSSSLNLKDDELHINSQEKMRSVVYETKKGLDMLQTSCSKNLTQTELYSKFRRTVSHRRTTESPDLLRVPTISDHKMENEVEKQPNFCAKLSDQLCTQKHENIVVLLSRDASSTPSDVLLMPDSRVYMDKEVLGSVSNSSSDLLSCEGGRPEISQYCPQPHDAKSCDQTAFDQKSHPDGIHDIKILPKVSQIFPFSNASNVESSDYVRVQLRTLIPEHGEFCRPETSLRLDQAFREHAAPNSRSSSPLRHLSNGFSRMRRNLSSKDISVIAPSISKRFPTNVGVPTSSVDSCKDKTSAGNKARSSPLRRLIDPLLKTKLAITAPYVDELTRSAKGTKMLDTASGHAARYSRFEKEKEDTVQALIQFSCKNGLPMFKLVAKKKGDALVATIANTSAREKRDMSLNFTLYSVKEMTKNSSWMYQGRTSKNSGYLYDIAGQMELCMPSLDKTTSASSSELFSMVESTLLGVQPSETAQETMKVKLIGELAAILIKTPKDCLRIGEKMSNPEKFFKEFGECMTEDSLTKMTGSSKRLTTTVILPAGVHSMPNKGAPSLLIHRWKSGGSCDCGGWDVGCNLSILHNEKECYEPAEHCEAIPVSECFQLYSQAGDQGKGPSFRLTPFSKGIYSVEFKPSTLSDLQAFFISITVLSSQMALDISRGTEYLEAKDNPELT
uniref:Uncharacterized protein n=1 Tax=Kalanchoe fedtschenkoi TaxID=63787 RepID=A0A7N0TTP7_KALFE